MSDDIPTRSEPSRSRKSQPTLTPRAGLEALLGQFEADPAGAELTCSWCVPLESCPPDFLLCFTLWTPYDRAEREPDELWCLRTETTAFKLSWRIGSGDFPAWLHWCNDPADLPALRAAVEGSLPFAEVADTVPPGVASLDELHDTWGAPFAVPPDNNTKSVPTSFDESTWEASTDAPAMLRWYRQTWTGDQDKLDRRLARYYLACGRRIWPLLPQEASRNGIEVAERFLDGQATEEEFRRAEYHAEGAAFNLDYNGERGDIAAWCRQVARIPSDALFPLLHRPRAGATLTPRGLLNRAAYFADHAMCSWTITPRDAIDRYAMFLSAPVLREVVENPFR